MKNFIVLASICFSLILAGPVLAAEAVGTAGTTAGGLACHAHDLGDEATATFDRWIELNEKNAAKTITEAEAMEGYLMQKTGECADLRTGFPAKVAESDDVNYLLEVCAERYPCVLVITRQSGFTPNE